MGSDLRRFRTAQDDHASFETALREIRHGRKETHWIWYVFPQLAGLGRSSAAVHFGLRDVDEARDYLRDPVLRDRLLAAARAVAAHLTRDPALPLVHLMGSDIDALKLVSSMTLFHQLADELHRDEPLPEHAELVQAARTILEAGTRQGYPPCDFTLGRLAASSPSSPPARRDGPGS